jgi:pyrroloquinoline-quinone synthase
MKTQPWSSRLFTAKLRAVGAAAYHHQHPFHLLMNSGKLERKAVQTWVANRLYYQTSIPIKDAALMSNCPIREVRRLWLHRIVDHDGMQGDEGGIGAWLRLGEACGLSRQELLGGERIAPGVRFAVDAYVNFARTQPWPIAVASSLTELFAPDLMAKRLEAFQKYYPWVKARGLEYFKNRLTQAPRDSGEALTLTVNYCRTRELQEQAVEALRFKCELLWSMLDAIHLSCLADGSLAELPAGPKSRRVSSKAR